MSMIPPIIPFIGKPEAKKYRILEPGEALQEGDELLFLGKWMSVGVGTHTFIASEVVIGDKACRLTYRRLVK